MRRMVTTEQAKVLDNFAVNKEETATEISGNVALESIEKLGIITPKYNYMDIVTDSKFTRPTYNQVIVLVENATEITEVGGTWSNTGALQYQPDEGEITYFIGSGLYYKLNGQLRYIAFDKSGALTFKGDLTDAGKKYIGYALKGGFTPFFTEEQYQAILNLIK